MEGLPAHKSPAALDQLCCRALQVLLLAGLTGNSNHLMPLGHTISGCPEPITGAHSKGRAIQKAVQGAPSKIGNVGDPVAPQPQLLQLPQRAQAFNGCQAIVSQLQQLQLVQVIQALQLHEEPWWQAGCIRAWCLLLSGWSGCKSVERGRPPWRLHNYSIAQMVNQ